MKKIIIIFIIVFCLLLFMGGISCLAKEAISPGGMWNSLDDNNKIIYIKGVSDGMLACMCKLSDWLPGFTNTDGAALFFAILEDNEHFIGLLQIDDYEMFLNQLKIITNIISDLYKDPANTYIDVANMCLIASRKLRGEPIESLLRELRKDALP